MRIGNVLRATGLATVLAMGTTGCGGGESTPAEEGARGAKGGTLYVLVTGDFEHLDPARNYVTDGGDFGQRLLYRSLTQYKAAPGEAGLEIAPDLATDLGKASADKKTWTFTLKDGLKYEDGSPITAQDVKYGTERSFAPDLPEGPPWARQLLVGGAQYKGPYKEEGGLDSIEAPDDKTIVFHLNQPVADFNYAVTFPLFGPVPEDKDTGVKYDNRPFSSGPYKIQNYDRGKELVLVRNKHWSQSTDPVRKARPDKIVVNMGIDPSVIDQRLLADQGDDQYAIMLEDVEPATVSKIVTNPDVKERLVQDVSGCNRYLGLNTSRPPMDNLKVRQAINYALSQKAYQTARGGPFIGRTTTEITPSTLAGHKDFNLYPNNNGKGDPAKARQLLAEAGYPDGIEVTLTSTSEASAYGPDPSAAIQQSLAKAGITVNINAVSEAVYYTEIGNAKRETHMVYYGWCPDWPSARTFIPPLLDGRFIQAQGNTNVSQYDNAEVSQRIDEIYEMADPAEANQAWGDLEEQIMRDAPAVPLMDDNRSALRGSKVTGAFPHQAYSSLIDFATVGVQQ
ncbi:MAG: ABC transporter substrate-binding protein [Carbonactinosporaceae bacterium]